MPFAEALARTREGERPPAVPKELEAKAPAEERGAGRGDVRLLVTPARRREMHASFSQLADFLHSGDLLVLNRSATIPAAFLAQRGDRSLLRLHVSTRLPADLFLVEPRQTELSPGERLRLPGGAMAEVLTPYLDSKRLMIARFYLAQPFIAYAFQHGDPIRYAHAPGSWPLDTYQNVYADEPGSAEMPSAGRPLTFEQLADIRERGVGIAYITLHAGVSSPEHDEPPYEERYDVPFETAAAIARARRRGGRVIAVGTTVVRALESATDDRGRVAAARGWTDLIVTPQRGVDAVDGLLTGFHDLSSSHLAMLEAIAGPERIGRAYRTALKERYLWHEFGDSHLIFRA
ncbi:MAG: S-adenosylmethionine:tRNA ribosyltransferase-isomerase [Candidatus Eremiobacteraeota bacterium]|nr:S-adenosylmethionine:tRNA ribosyltransferase-isomerase [Candidatus Eremiobacteraeota bacterium]